MAAQEQMAVADGGAWRHVAARSSRCDDCIGVGRGVGRGCRSTVYGWSVRQWGDKKWGGGGMCSGGGAI